PGCRRGGHRTPSPAAGATRRAPEGGSARTCLGRCGAERWPVMNPRGPGVDDTLVNFALAFIAAVAVLAALLRLAGTLAARLSGAARPDGGWTAGLGVLANPGDPAGALGAEG